MVAVTDQTLEVDVLAPPPRLESELQEELWWKGRHEWKVDVHL